MLYVQAMADDESNTRALIMAILIKHRYGQGPGWCAGCNYQPDRATRERVGSAYHLMLEHQADVLMERLGLR